MFLCWISVPSKIKMRCLSTWLTKHSAIHTKISSSQLIRWNTIKTGVRMDDDIVIVSVSSWKVQDTRNPDACERDVELRFDHYGIKKSNAILMMMLLMYVKLERTETMRSHQCQYCFACIFSAPFHQLLIMQIMLTSRFRCCIKSFCIILPKFTLAYHCCIQETLVRCSDELSWTCDDSDVVDESAHRSISAIAHWRP